MAAPADLVLPKGLGFGFGLGLGLGLGVCLGLAWSGSTGKDEIGHTQPAQKLLQVQPAHNARRLLGLECNTEGCGRRGVSWCELFVGSG